jgi:hypothetical protein
VAVIISSIFTVFLIGLSTGGLLVSRRIDPHQTLFLFVGLAFFLFFYIGMFIGSKLVGFVSHGAMSIFFGLFCLGLIGFLVWKYDPGFGYVKQEPATLSIFLVLFLLLGIEVAILELSLWFSLFGTALFGGGLFLGFIFIYQIIHRHRSSQLLALIPLVPLLFIGLFKLI